MSFAMYHHPRTLTLLRRVSMTTYIILPTVLYIKQHPITGIKYFGKTTRDPLKYKGSGKHWLRHLKKHGRKHIITTQVFGPFTNSIAISEFALAFSRYNNIVESKDWANMKPENGLDGGFDGPPWNKGIPAWNKGIPAGRQQNPSGPRGPQQNPTGPRGPRGPRGKQQNPAPEVECPHCGKIGKRNMTRDHFDNCKRKPPEGGFPEAVTT